MATVEENRRNLAIYEGWEKEESKQRWGFEPGDLEANVPLLDIGNTGKKASLGKKTVN